MAANPAPASSAQAAPASSSGPGGVAASGNPTSNPRPSNASPTPTTWSRPAARKRASSTITGAEPMVTRVARLTEVSDDRGEVAGLEERGEQAGGADPPPGGPAARQRGGR